MQVPPPSHTHKLTPSPTHPRQWWSICITFTTHPTTASVLHRRLTRRTLKIKNGKWKRKHLTNSLRPARRQKTQAQRQGLPRRPAPPPSPRSPQTSPPLSMPCKRQTTIGFKKSGENSPPTDDLALPFQRQPRAFLQTTINSSAHKTITNSSQTGRETHRYIGRTD